MNIKSWNKNLQDLTLRFDLIEPQYSWKNCHDACFQSLSQDHYLKLYNSTSTKLMVRVVFLWVTLEWRSWWKFNSVWKIDIWFLELKKTCIFEKVFDALFLLLDYNSLFYPLRIGSLYSVLIIFRKALLFGLYLGSGTNLVLFTILEGWGWVA